jgi:hypothetical protein
MAIRTEEHALRCLLPRFRQRSGQPSRREPEVLLLRVEVVKGEGPDASVVTAEHASAAGLRD